MRRCARPPMRDGLVRPRRSLPELRAAARPRADTSSMTICLEDRCPTRVESPARRCPEHEAQWQRARPSANDLGYTSKWRTFSKRFLRDHPRCNRCAGPSAHTHHIDELGPNGPRGFDRRNCEALCSSCHNSHTASGQARGGPGKAHLGRERAVGNLSGGYPSAKPVFEPDPAENRPMPAVRTFSTARREPS